MLSPEPSADLAAPESSPQARALLQAMGALLEPLARLAVARGVAYGEVEELLRQAFVKAAREAHTDLLPHRMVSRVSTVTGINRREVTRLMKHSDAGGPPRRSVATEVFAKWVSNPEFQLKPGTPLVLPRQGRSPSFEALAQSVTRDVHPRSILEELLRLGLAVLDEQKDTVALARDAFVPRGDAVRMLGFLGANVGDHLSAAVANVLGDGRRHFEQAVFVDALSAASLDKAEAQVREQWQLMRGALVPVLQALEEADAQGHEGPLRRLRIGLFTFDDAADAAAPDTGKKTP